MTVHRKLQRNVSWFNYNTQASYRQKPPTVIYNPYLCIVALRIRRRLARSEDRTAVGKTHHKTSKDQPRHAPVSERRRYPQHESYAVEALVRAYAPCVEAHKEGVTARNLHGYVQIVNRQPVLLLKVGDPLERRTDDNSAHIEKDCLVGGGLRSHSE